MPNEGNIRVVEELADKLKRAEAVYFTDYLGLDVSNITTLRRQFYQASVEYRVAKNTLIKLAAEKNNIEGVDEFLIGPTALAISYSEPTIPARVLKDFTKTHDKPTVKGILFEGKVLLGEEFKWIADLPSREELIAKLAATIQSPITKFVRTMSAPISKLVGVLNSIKDKKS